ncbi:MAG: histidine utilization repressor [Pseudomonadota bacterium]
MAFALHHNDPRPKYEQIKDLVRGRITSGHWAAGTRLPSENEWVDELGVSRMTVNRALRELHQEGHIDRVHGVGTFVATRVAHASLIELRDIALEIAERGHAHRVQLIRQRTESLSTRAATAMELAPGTSVARVSLVHYENDTPIQFEDRWVNPACVPRFLEQDFSQSTPTAYLMAQFGPDDMEHRVQAVLPDASTARHLDVSRDTPCLRLTRRTWKAGEMVTRAVMTSPGSRYDLIARYAT